MTRYELSLLFARISKGDEKAFETVFKEMYDPVFSTALAYGKSRELARDVAQHVFLKVWERRELLLEVDNPLAWLHTAARYHTLHLVRTEMQKGSYMSQILESLYKEEVTPETSMVHVQQERFLNNAIEQLPDKQRQIYRLSREEGMTYAQIGERLGLAHETIKDYMAKALKTLRHVLNEHKNDLIGFVIIFSIFFFKN